MWTCNRSDLQTLGSQPVMPKNLPDHCYMATRMHVSYKEWAGTSNSHSSCSLRYFTDTSPVCEKAACKKRMNKFSKCAVSGSWLGKPEPSSLNRAGGAVHVKVFLDCLFTQCRRRMSQCAIDFLCWSRAAKAKERKRRGGTRFKPPCIWWPFEFYMYKYISVACRQIRKPVGFWASHVLTSYTASAQLSSTPDPLPACCFICLLVDFYIAMSLPPSRTIQYNTKQTQPVSRDWSFQCPSNAVWAFRIYLSQNNPSKGNPKLQNEDLTWSRQCNLPATRNQRA